MNVITPNVVLEVETEAPLLRLMPDALSVVRFTAPLVELTVWFVSTIVLPVLLNWNVPPADDVSTVTLPVLEI